MSDRKKAIALWRLQSTHRFHARVSLERTVRPLEDARLSWGHELVKELATVTVGGAMKKFQIAVAR